MSTAKASGRSRSATLKIVKAMLLLMFVVVLGPGQALAHDDGDDDGWDGKWHHKVKACAQTSKAAFKACKLAAQEDYNLALGRCKNVAKSEQDDCIAEAKDDFRSALEECPEQFDARQDVCEAIGPGPYLPEGIPPGFAVDPLPEGNDYFPLTPGTIYTYRLYIPIESDDPQETIVVEVKDDTREIAGVTCRVVQDTAYEEDGSDLDKKIEDTTDWYALNTNGDVWYFGEIALNFEEGIISNIDGSWTAGVEGAKPGILMYADPEAHEGETYRQEFALSEAEDDAKIAGFVEFSVLKGLYPILEKLPIPIDDGTLILHTEEFSALEPGVVEDKYYARGVGNILIVKPATDTDPEEMEVLEGKVGP